VHTTAEEAARLGVGALLAAGASERAAAIQAEVLVEAELRGHPSHGLLRLPLIVERIGAGLADPRTTGRTRWAGQALLEVDGEYGLGPVVAVAALDMVCRRVDRTGVACAAVRSSNHLGMLAWYVERVAELGLVGLALTTSEAMVHPWGGRRPMLGTNPIAVAVPAEPAPLVLDMATGLVSMGRIIDHANRGEPLQHGWALDRDGEPTIDARAARDGAIAPFGAAKGYGLGIAFEAVVAAMTSSALGTDVVGTLDSVHPSTKGDVFIVLKPDAAAPAWAVSRYLDEVRASPPVDPRRPVLVPGDRARACRRERIDGGFDVPDDLWDRLAALPTARDADMRRRAFRPVGQSG
jgi:LDH2 family malate/lactate/ureidoglycolate dehydrogenase